MEQQPAYLPGDERIRAGQQLEPNQSAFSIESANVGGNQMKEDS